MKKPDFLIIGTMKSGTSTLSKYLERHPQIGIPKKEVHFFDRHADKGLEWYSDQLKKSGDSNTLIYGEKTPFYAWTDEIAESIYRINPNMKLIWLFRDPIERVLSHYRHNIKSGRDWLTIKKAFRDEQSRSIGDLQLGYVLASQYELQIERYLKYFDRKQMLFESFEYFVGNQEAFLKRVTNFLGVNSSPFVQIPPANEGDGVKLLWLNYVLGSYIGKNNRIFSSFYNWNSSSKKIAMPEDLKSELKLSFKETEAYVRNNCLVDTSLWKNWKT